MTTSIQRMQQRRGTKTEWEGQDPAGNSIVLASGEIGFVKDIGGTHTQSFKIGDGTLPWNDLLYQGLGNLDVSEPILKTITSLKGTNLSLKTGQIGGLQMWDADLDAIAALTGTSGFLKKTAANTWELSTPVDNNYYPTAVTITGTTTPIIGLTMNTGTVTTANIPLADGTTTAGIVSVGTQTFGGAKTFSSTISGSISGNAATATSAGKLTTPISINGVTNIDWSATSYTFPAAAGTLTGTTINSTVVSSSLTKVGALSNGIAGFVKVDTAGNLTSDGTAYLPTSTGFQNTLATAVSIASINTFYTGPSITLTTAGTYLIMSTVTVLTTATAQHITGKLWNGTTTYASTQVYAAATAENASISLQSIQTVAANTTVSVAIASSATGGSVAIGTLNQSGTNASMISAIRIA